MKCLILLGITMVTLCDAMSIKRQSCPLICTMEYMPVCGSDGKTYGNNCEMNIATCQNATIIKDHDGPCSKRDIADAGRLCQNMLCSTIYQPVCGSDGKSYSNACALTSRTCGSNVVVTVAHQGPC